MIKEPGRSITETLLPDPSAIVVLSFFCEARFAPELQLAGVELLRRLASAGVGSNYVPPFKSTDGEKDAWTAPEWSNPADEAAARWLVNDLCRRPSGSAHWRPTGLAH